MTDPQLPPPPPEGFVFVPPSPPPGYPPAPTGYAAPPGASAVPVGGYAAPAGLYTPRAAPQPQSTMLGIIALISSLIAAVVSPIVIGIVSSEIGYRLPEISSRIDNFSSMTLLSPVRDQVLWAELAFWTGTLTGLAAIALGIIAIAKRRGRWQGVTAVVLGVLGVIVFFVVLLFALSVGASVGVTTQFS